jgi:hypothetical protein
MGIGWRLGNDQRFTNYISKRTGTLRTGELYGWTLDNTLVGEGGINPDDRDSIAYLHGRVREGSISQRINGRDLARQSIPSNFSLVLWVRPKTLGADGTFLRS